MPIGIRIIDSDMLEKTDIYITYIYIYIYIYRVGK